MPGTYLPPKARKKAYKYPDSLTGILQGYSYVDGVLTIWLSGYKGAIIIDPEAGGVTPGDVGKVIELEYRLDGMNIYATVISVNPIATTAVVN